MQNPVQDQKRRRFLFASATVSAGAVAAVATQVPQVKQAIVAAQAPKSTGYHETSHVREYYDSARI